MSTAVDDSTLIEELPKLNELQQVDLRIGELLALRAELDDGSAKQAELLRAQARLDQVNRQLGELRGRQVDRRLERDTLDERRERDQHKLWQELPTQAEAEALQRDLQAIANRLDTIKIELEDFENRIEPLEHQAEDEQRTVSELTEELEQVRTQFADEVKDIDAELKSLRAERTAKSIAVTGPLLHRYETIRRRRGDPGVVMVTEDVCTACNTQLTRYMLRQLQLARTVQNCENCNTILYWAGEARPIAWLEEWREQLEYDDED